MKAINIISFDVPYPANYGGVIDVFYKVKAFYNCGVEVHLHCFDYGRGKQPELEKYCKSVQYYKRKTNKIALLSSIPYIVRSRVTKRLKTNLLKNNYPILFEGLHCCYLLSDIDLKNRFKIVRAHNIEHEYYSNLSKNENNAVRKKYYKSEAKKLKKFESILNHANLCLAISEKDTTYFSTYYQHVNTIHVPPFHQSETVNIKEGLGDYVLYHGNLSVNENKKAVEYIVNNICNKINTQFIIAGLNPDKNIIELIDKYSNIKLLQNLSDNDLHKLIINAQINLLYTHQATGLKLKLLNVLYNSRHCLVNSKMIQESKLAECCTIANNTLSFVSHIKSLMKTEVSSQELNKRKILLNNYYSNKKNIQKVISHL